MDGVWLARLRWRRRGAWMWPMFIVLTLVDAVIGHLLPPAGDSQTLFGAALLALFINLIGVILLTFPSALVVRRLHPDMPMVVARNYGGTGVVVGVTVVLLLVGLLHQPTIDSQQSAMRDAIERAEAYIGDRAPAEFRRNVQYVDAFAIQPGSIYRACVPGASADRTYCVIVNTHLPFGTSVSFAGYEPNSLFSEGVG
jgi:uncharacterized membrane protein YhaH (DUF805 family)